jgi:hypothetical protein
MELHAELFMRIKAFIQSVSNVCPSCPRRSDATCPVCVCQPAKRLLHEIETETGTAAPEPAQRKHRPAAEVLVLRFIRKHEKSGTQFSYCINRIKIKGIESWEKQRAIKQLCADGLVEITNADPKRKTLKHAQTVIDRRDDIDEELKKCSL